MEAPIHYELPGPAISQSAGDYHFTSPIVRSEGSLPDQHEHAVAVSIPVLGEYKEASASFERVLRHENLLF